MTTTPSDSSVAPAATAMPTVPAEIIELDKTLFLAVTMSSGSRFGFYLGNSRPVSTCGPVTGSVFGIVPDAPLSAVEAYNVANNLGLQIVTFSEYALELRCSSEFYGQAKGDSKSRVRPHFIQALKDCGQVHSADFIVDARSGEDTVRYGHFSVSARDYGIKGKLAHIRQGFDSQIRPKINIVRVKEGLYQVSFSDLANIREIDSACLLNHGDHKPSDDWIHTGYYLVESKGLDLEHKVDHEEMEDMTEADPSKLFTCASFRPGYIGPIGTGGYYRSKMVPDFNMYHLSNRGLIVHLD